MEPQPWTDQHSGAIADAAPAVPPTDADELDRVWARVRSAMDAPATRRRRPARVALLAGLTAAALTAGGVAAAEVYSAHTGRYSTDAEDIRLGGPGEWLDPAASDYGDVVTSLTGDIPFPSERARGIAKQTLVDDGKREAPGTGVESTGAIRGWTAQYAVCSWASQWAVATRTGDEASRAEAVRMLDEAPGWPAVTDLDPEQQIRYQTSTVTDRSGKKRTVRFDNNTQFGYLPLIKKAVHGRDVDAMGRLLVR